MSFKSNEDLKLILHPYAFALKDGDGGDDLDYTLMMVQVGAPETLKSPKWAPLPQARSTELLLPSPKKALERFHR